MLPIPVNRLLQPLRERRYRGKTNLVKNFLVGTCPRTGLSLPVFVEIKKLWRDVSRPRSSLNAPKHHKHRMGILMMRVLSRPIACPIIFPKPA